MRTFVTGVGSVRRPYWPWTMTDSTRSDTLASEDWQRLLIQKRHPRTGTLLFTADTETPSADPVIALHGIGNDGGVFAPILPMLARHGPVAAPTMTPDLMEDGDVERPHAFATLVDWLSEVHPPPWRLIGHSMGGVLAGLVARSRPDLVISAVLLNSPLPGAIGRIKSGDTLDRTGRAMLAMKALARISSLGRPRLPGWLRGTELGIVRTALRGFVLDTGALDDAVIEEAIIRSRTTDGVDFLRLARQLPEWESEPFIDRPVAIIVGESDPLIADSDHALIQGYYPDAPIHIMERCGHFTHLEQPELTVELIEQFFTAAD